MKQGAGRKGLGLRKTQEITIVRHIAPGLVKKTGPLPAVNNTDDDEFPQSTRYLHLHPVFKFVDNFLSSTTMNKKTTMSPQQDTQKRRDYLNKNLQPERPQQKKFVTKKCSIPKRTQERIKANLNNIHSKSTIRLSLKPLNCPHRPVTTRTNPVSKEKEFKKSPPKTLLEQQIALGTGCNYYVEQLKNEIKNNRIVSDKSNNYADKLRQEIASNRANCLEEAKNVINELKTEILNYRLRLKSRYSSSLSDIEANSSTFQKNKDCSYLKSQEHSLELNPLLPPLISGNLLFDFFMFGKCQLIGFHSVEKCYYENVHNTAVKL